MDGRNHPTKKNIREIFRKNLLNYFNEIVLKINARNHNNYNQKNKNKEPTFKY